MKDKGNNRKNGLTNILLGLVFTVGISLLLYPTVSDWWNSFHQSRAIAGYTEQIAKIDTAQFETMWNEAQEYNTHIRMVSNRWQLSDEELDRYRSILDVTGTGIMGYVEIPKIKVSLPIYHGTDESVLQIAIGHIAGSSLPVGGEGVHTVISGHRGLPSAKLFTDIDRLEKGDRFLLQILGETLTYEVDEIHIVLPSELDQLEIVEGEDYCTLVTCTPYGINTHRLLVRGHRVENDKETLRVTADAIQIEPMVAAIGVGVCILVILFIVLMVAPVRRHE